MVVNRKFEFEFESRFTPEQVRELNALATERYYRCQSDAERESIDQRRVVWSTKSVGALLAEFEEDCGKNMERRDAAIRQDRAKAKTMFAPKVYKRLIAARVKDVRVVGCEEAVLDALMEETGWDLRCGAIVQDALIIAQHNGRYVLFDRDAKGGWNNHGLALQNHHYFMTAHTLSSLDEAVLFVARYLVRHKLANRGRG